MINGFCYLFTVAFFACSALFTAYCAVIYFYAEKERSEISFRNFVCLELTDTLAFLMMTPEIVKEKPTTLRKKKNISFFEKVVRRVKGSTAEIISFENHKNKKRG